MKFNEETMKKAFESFMKDDFWKDLYEGAPENAKRRLRVAFWGSRYMDQREDIDQYRAYREKVESEMAYEDAAYLAEFFPEGAGKDHYIELRDNIEMAPIRSKEKLDEAIDSMLEYFSADEREAIEKTRRLINESKDPCLKYTWLWGAVAGVGSDCEMVGDLFDHGHGVTPDPELAYFWFRRGALCGDGDSCARLAECHEEEGPRFDMEKTKFWFAEGIRRRSICAKIDLGARLTTREDSPWEQLRNPELGVHLLHSASLEKDGERALYYLGKCAELGVGLDRDLKNALYYYRLAEKENVCYADEAVKRVRRLLREERGR